MKINEKTIPEIVRLARLAEGPGLGVTEFWAEFKRGNEAIAKENAEKSALVQSRPLRKRD
jgi:hypothetical protein